MFSDNGGSDYRDTRIKHLEDMLEEQKRTIQALMDGCEGMGGSTPVIRRLALLDRVRQLPQAWRDASKGGHFIGDAEDMADDLQAVLSGGDSDWLPVERHLRVVGESKAEREARQLDDFINDAES